MKNNNKAGQVSSLALSFVVAMGSVAPAFATGANHHNGNEEGGSALSTSSSGATSSSVANGGMGGMGGAGGNVQNSITGPTTTVGGQNTSVGGQATTQSSSMSNVTNYRAPMIPGFAPMINANSFSECGEGVGISLGGPWSAAGFGKTSQNETCQSQRFNSTFINSGVVMATNADPAIRKEGKAIMASGIRSQMKINEGFKSAVEEVAANTQQPCVKAAGDEVSIILMAQELTCDKDGKVAIKEKPVVKAKAPELGVPNY